MRWRVLIAVLLASFATAGLVVAAPTVVIDFTTTPPPARYQIGDDEEAALLKRFPHPHAAPGEHCDPNFPGAPPKERAGGTLLPTITKVTAAVTRVGATQTTYLIDYCPTGNGVPRTRRLLILEGTTVAADRELPAGIPAETVLAATDIDGDGLAELVLTATIDRKGRATEVAYLVRTDLKLLGSWTVREFCSPGTYNEEVLHTITIDAKHQLHDASTKRHCFYPPSPSNRQ